MSGARMYGDLYSFAKSFDEKIGWGRVGVLLSVTIIAVAAVALYHTLRDINFDEVVDAIAAVEKHDVARAALFVAGGYFTLTFYDLFALRTIGRADVPYRVAALAGFTSYAGGDKIGASAFTRRGGGPPLFFVPLFLGHCWPPRPIRSWHSRFLAFSPPTWRGYGEPPARSAGTIGSSRCPTDR